MIKEKLFILKDLNKNEILEQRLLFDDEFSKSEIVENPPKIGVVDGKIGRYSLDETGELVVIYDDVVMSDAEKIADLERQVAELTKSMEEFYRFVRLKKGAK